MVVLSVLVSVLGVALLAALVALVVTSRRLTEVRVERDQARHELRAARPARRGQRVDQATTAAGHAVRTVVETASRLRERGFRSTLLSSLGDFTDWALEQRVEIARIAASDGTVTIFFSDIENSTALNSELGDEQWVRLLRSHDRLVTTYVDKHRGEVVKSQGDGYMVVFSTPDLGVAAALDIQRALGAKRKRDRHLRRTPIRVRIGLHTGTTVEREGDYFGSNVAMAARIAALADGGEVLVSDTVAAAVGDQDDLRLSEVDTVELKGLDGEHTLWLVEELAA